MVRNPADTGDIIGRVWEPTPTDVETALTGATQSAWGEQQATERAGRLRRAADAMQARMPILIGLIVREAGRTVANAIAEVREAVDFLRYYANEAEQRPEASALGPVACISPWNFPLAIFTGQVAAALAAGNPVLAKPAEQTPLIAAEAVRILHQAGIPADALHLLPGDGTTGAALVADHRIQAVIFTGSDSVARHVHRQLSNRLTKSGQPVPLIAETGGQNAMIVDPSALTEQVVADVITSAFDSAGQRCSALRILCLQEEIADTTLSMLKGAMEELTVGNPTRLPVDVGALITAEAREDVLDHIQAMRTRGHAVYQLTLPPETAHGSFVAPTLIEIARITDLDREVFGPVLHVLRYRRDELDRVVDAINATGYGLTFGLHTRIDETVARVTARIRAGNLYINRNMIGATVGVQPFGGSGLSGTGPKAGGPLYLTRLCNGARKYASVGQVMTLPGPVGETNVYSLHPCGRVGAIAATGAELHRQIAAILATGNSAVVETIPPGLAPDVVGRVSVVPAVDRAADLRAVLFQGDTGALLALTRRVAARDGAIVQVQAAVSPNEDYDLERLLQERSVAANTAAGGNASLLAIGG